MKLIRLLKAAKIFKIIEEEMDINMSLLKLGENSPARRPPPPQRPLSPPALRHPRLRSPSQASCSSSYFLGHLFACFSFLGTQAQPATTAGMFRGPSVYGCAFPLGCARYPGDLRLGVSGPDAPMCEFREPDLEPSPVDGNPTYYGCGEMDSAGVYVEGDNEFLTHKIRLEYLYPWVLYWTMTTMTTIGYGDVTPKSWQESLITIFVELVGASVFGYMIGNIASVISEMDQFGAQLKARMDGLKNYLTYKKFVRAASPSPRALTTAAPGRRRRRAA